MSKVRRSIKRIDDPAVTALSSNPIGFFLGENGMVWKMVS